MIAADGFGGLYRGVSAPLVGVAPIFALSFAGNAAGQQMIRSATGHDKLSYGEFFLGGCIAGVYSTVIMAPGERIKVTSHNRYGKILNNIIVSSPNSARRKIQRDG